MDMSRPRVAIVAALEREVWPLVDVEEKPRPWRKPKRFAGTRVRVFLSEGAVVLVCGGIGTECARRATEAVIQLYDPALVVSAGFAGATTRGCESWTGAVRREP